MWICTSVCIQVGTGTVGLINILSHCWRLSLLNLSEQGAHKICNLFMSATLNMVLLTPQGKLKGEREGKEGKGKGKRRKGKNLSPKVDRAEIWQSRSPRQCLSPFRFKCWKTDILVKFHVLERFWSLRFWIGGAGKDAWSRHLLNTEQF